MPKHLFWDVAFYIFENGGAAIYRLWLTMSMEEMNDFYTDFLLMPVQPDIEDHVLLGRHFINRYPGLRGL